MSVFDAILGQRRAEYRAEVARMYEPPKAPPAPKPDPIAELARRLA
jgi:hypothetical protein